MVGLGGAGGRAGAGRDAGRRSGGLTAAHRRRADLDPAVFWALLGLEARAADPGAVMVVGSVTTPSGQTARWQLGAGTDDLLADEWDGVAERLAALGHPVRLRLLRHVLHGRSTARELTEVEGIGTRGQVYHHLRQLTAAGWLRNRGSHYEVPVESVVPLLTTVLGGRR
ncbi:helix-turn-helix transcriptional regulator [uncultured Serinicoccus sp.]|uniref:ArsR/SmtB family transcription factor n=1 Tax=uncultured Serinicoccus sp. TaxID=735514 RepID=UPI00260831F7|nr:helix-turn-helix domain-containing protein [uncultured Serinicoccus sp.]